MPHQQRKPCDDTQGRLRVLSDCAQNVADVVFDGSLGFVLHRLVFPSLITHPSRRGSDNARLGVASSKSLAFAGHGQLHSRKNLSDLRRWGSCWFALSGRRVRRGGADAGRGVDHVDHRL